MTVPDGMTTPIQYRQANTIRVQLSKAPPTCMLQSKINDIQPEEYIWQRDPFRITVDESGYADESISFGDNIQDEWMIVYIVKQLTLEFEDLVARLTDDDGQFLLIEAANALPNWVRPETCESRAFLYQGNVHIIPMKFQFASLDEACEIIRQNSDVTVSPPVTAVIDARLETLLDQAVSSCQHLGRCLLHEDAVKLLDLHPWLITAIAESFYFRDPIDVKHCSRMQRFTPDPERYMWHAPRFTHCSYAQLEAQQFSTPKSFESCRPSSEDQQSGFIRGVKLMCGLEILYQNQKRLLEKGKHLDHIIRDVHSGSNLVELIDGLDVRSLDRIPFEQVRDDDPSPWMNINEDDLTATMQSYVGKEFSAEDIAKKMHKFMSHVSDFEGISNLDAPISFDTSEFLNAFNSDDDEGDDFYEEVTSDEDMAEYHNNLEQEMDMKPVNANINLVQNLLEAYKAEFGQSGPVSTLFSSLGIHMPDDETD